MGTGERVERVWISRSEAETNALGGCLAAAIKPPLWIGLEGTLGVGKTRFVQGVAEGLGYQGRVRSPTFVLENRYSAKLPLYHQDLYRLSEPDDEIVAGWEENERGIYLVEWSSRTEEAPERSIEIRFERARPDESGPNREVSQPTAIQPTANQPTPSNPAASQQTGTDADETESQGPASDEEDGEFADLSPRLIVLRIPSSTLLDLQKLDAAVDALDLAQTGVDG